MRVLFRFCYGLLALFCALTLTAVGYVQYALPDEFSVGHGQTLRVGEWVTGQPVGDTVPAAAGVGDRYPARLTLGGLIPVKEVAVTVTRQRTVLVGGTPFGIKLYTDGVLVVGLSDIPTAAGDVNPASAAGVCVGDTVLAVNGESVTTRRDMSRLVNGCEGRPVTLRLRRDGVEFTATFTPVRPVGETGYRAGLWVRDSTAGVGTLTFYDPATGMFAGLGHAVCDSDTGQVMSLSQGEVVPARIFGVKKGTAGDPGELSGTFDPGKLGRLLKNGEDGLYGTLAVVPPGTRSLPVARRQQVKEGKAQLITTLDGTTPAVYEVEIERVRYTGVSATRNMVIRVTDPRLLSKTGGIVQGMSGSPIIQNGKLIGAVTHVLVDDPTKGYGIFAENMLETAQSVAQEQLKDAS